MGSFQSWCLLAKGTVGCDWMAAVLPSRAGYWGATGLLQCRGRWTWLKLNLAEVGQSPQNTPLAYWMLSGCKQSRWVQTPLQPVQQDLVGDIC